MNKESKGKINIRIEMDTMFRIRTSKLRIAQIENTGRVPTIDTVIQAGLTALEASNYSLPGGANATAN